VYFEYICSKFAGRLLDRVNTLLLIAMIVFTSHALSWWDSIARWVNNICSRMKRSFTLFTYTWHECLPHRFRWQCL